MEEPDPESEPEPEPEPEPEIQEYLSYKGGHENTTTMMKWILKKGYGIGKKMAITGIAISAAPLILPPILVFSAMGVAFSIPSGFVFASYACTNKLMTTLLPIPPSPFIPEYCTDEDEDDYFLDERGSNVVLGEVEFAEARGEAKGIVDENVDVLGLPAFRRVPLDTDNAEVTSKTSTKIPSREDALNDKMTWEKMGGERAIEHKGEETLLNSRLDENKGKEPLFENRLGEDRSKTQEVTKDSLEDIVKGSTGLLENVRDKGRFNDNTTEDDYFLDDSATNVVSQEVKDVETTEPVTVNEGNVEDNTVEDEYFLDESSSNVVLEKVEDAETTEPVIVREIETKKLVKDGSKNDKPIGEIHHVVILSPGSEGNNFNAREVEELDLVAREVVGDIHQDGGNIDSDEKVMRASMGTQEGTGSDKRDEGTNVASLRTRRDHLIHANVDAWKIDDETGLVLFDDQNTSVNFEGLADGGEAKGIVDENVDVLELPAFRRVPLDTDNAEVTSKTNTTTPSREGASNDKMTWEIIGGERDIEHKGEVPLLNSRLDENKGKEPLFENRVGEDKSKTQEVAKDSLVDIVKGSTGLLENVRDKGRVNDSTAEDDYFFDGSASNVFSQEVKDVETTEPVTVNEGNVEDNTVEDEYFLDESSSNVTLEKVEDAETTEPVIVREIETQKLVKDGSKNDKPIGEMHRVVILSSGSEGNNFNASEVEDLDLVAREVGDIDQDGGNIDSDEKVMTASMGTQEETGSDIRYEKTEDTSLRTRKDHLTHANVDAREMDGETSLDLFVDQNTSMNFGGLEARGEAKGIVDENVDVLELPAFRRVPLDTDNAEVVLKTSTKMPSREDALIDKMIWGKIGEKSAIEHLEEKSLLNSRLDENKGKERLLECRLGEDESETREVTKDSLEDIVKGSTGLLEKIRDKGWVNDNTVEDDHVSISNVVFEGIKEAEKTEPVSVKGIETQMPVQGGSKNNKTIGKMHHAVLLSAGNEQNNFNLRVEELDLVSRAVVVDSDKDGGDIDYDEKLMRESMGTHEKTSSCISDQGTEDASLKTKKDHLIHTNTDAREMVDESGLDLFDDQKISVKFQSSKGGGESKEIVVDENVDESALPAFRRVSLDTENGTVTSKTNAKTPSREDVLEDEKIWEKIVAMRTIVGYNAPSQPTCMGELKALYVFTGVEPPASFEGDTGLDEANAKLKFLMSIVGVK